MPDSSTQPTPIPTPMCPANYTDCGAMINEAKIASYMWYIHVTVRVNAADRLRHSLAYILGQATTATTPLSPSFSAPFGFTHINIAGSGNLGSRTLVREADRIDDLVDYFVLDHFSQAMLEILINTAPIEEYARGYERALAGIPANFREEFCRRLYGLLFSKYIVEWPQGIAVPEPAPGSIAAAAAATSGATSTESETVAASTSSDTDVSEHGGSPIQAPPEEGDDGEDDEEDLHQTRVDWILSSMDPVSSDDEAEGDYLMVGGQKFKYPAPAEGRSPPCFEPSLQLGPATPWPDTPSPGYNPELAKAAYFGTVSDPLPIQYRGIWGMRGSSSSSRDDGTARGACEKAKSGGEGVGEYACAAAGAASAANEEDASHDDPRLPSATRHQRQDQHQHQHQQHQQTQTPRPPHDATPQDRPASLPGSAHSRRVSHTGSWCSSCRARQAWSHGVGAQR